MAKDKKAAKELTIEEKLAQALVPVEEQPYKIPENWCWTYMGIVAQWGSGGTPSRKKPEYYEGRIPWVKTGELNNEYIYDTEEKITNEAVANSSAKLFPVNTVVIAMYGATIGKVGILGIEAATNQACAGGVCSNGLNYKYLFYYAYFQKNVFIRMAKGGAQPNISQDIIKNYPIPIPPLDEQIRTINCIESIFSKLDEAKEKAQAVVDGFELRKSAILYKAFTGELTKQWRKIHNIDEKSWEYCTLKEIIINGPQNGLYKPKTAYGNGTKILRIDGFYDGEVEPWDTLKRLYLSIEEIEMYKLNIEDIVINRVNSMAYLGKSALIRELPEACVFESNMMRISLNKKRIIPEYAIKYLNSSKGLGELRKNAKQAINQASINQQDVKNVMIILPQIDEQREIILIIKKLFDKEERAKKLAESIINQIDVMKNAVLARAFRGELGTNDLTEEAAIEVLKLILQKE